MPSGAVAVLVVAFVVVVLILVFLSRSIWLVPPARARNVERLGQFHKTLEPGLHLVIPMIDRVKDLIDPTTSRRSSSWPRRCCGA